MPKNLTRMSKTITTPVGEALFPAIHEPDAKFNPDNPVYQVHLVVGRAEAQEFFNEIDALVEEWKAENGIAPDAEFRMPYQDNKDAEGNDDGRIRIKTKLKSRGYEGREQKPRVFGKDGNPTTEPVGMGSLLQVGVEASPYHTSLVGYGVSLKLKAVRVVEARNATPQTAEAWGFTD